MAKRTTKTRLKRNLKAQGLKLPHGYAVEVRVVRKRTAKRKAR